MSWYASKEYACPKCGSKCIKEVSTLTLAQTGYWKCDKCSSGIEPLNNQKEKNNFVEKLKMSFIIKCPKCGEEQEFKNDEFKKGTIAIYLSSRSFGGESTSEMSIDCDCGNSIEHDEISY